MTPNAFGRMLSVGTICLVKAKPPLINFELIQFTRNEASQLGQSVYVVTRESCEQFPGERDSYPIDALFWSFCCCS